MPAVIDVSTQIHATTDRVWDVISDIDNEPKFWKGTKEVRNLSRDGNIVTREITIAFRDQKCLQEVTIKPKKEIRAKFIKGIIDGEKTITISSGEDHTVLINVRWEIRLTGIMGAFTSMIKRHIHKGTEQAMQNIKQEIEG